MTISSNSYVDAPSPILTVDIIVPRLLPDGRAGVLLIQRRWPPHGWALPGGHVDAGESCETAALRELLEETSLSGQLLYQMHTYSDPSRDPRKATVTVVYVANSQGEAVAADDAKHLQFWPLDELPPLCFDHRLILDDYVNGRYLPRHAPS